ncbi:MAG: division/cell wall cluster transcriptional repressor MraZ [Oscillospiraceae bacterium]|jgi:MraZ protein|nr:division/cell wall cluster transcriptional repressor MraZ [Oscillospiraceae bacterium]
MSAFLKKGTPVIYKSTIDVKGRMNIPAKLREELGESFHITETIDEYPILSVYSEDEWETVTVKIKAMPQIKARHLSRKIIGSEQPVKPDPQGRVLIAPSLREYAKLDGDVVLVDRKTKTEIWSKAVYDSYKENLDANMREELLQTAMDLEF